MTKDRLKYFRGVLLDQLRQLARQVSDEQASAIDAAGDGAKESADVALRDLIQELSLNLGDRDSQMIADIDQALMRMDEGSYGVCVLCGKPIDEKRLEALPTARYDATCQAAIEQQQGIGTRPSL
jgi:DnaK suppressor protein